MEQNCWNFFSILIFGLLACNNTFCNQRYKIISNTLHIIVCMVVLILQITNLYSIFFWKKKNSFLNIEPKFLMKVKMFTWNFHLNICELTLELMLVSYKNYGLRGFSWDRLFSFLSKKNTFNKLLPAITRAGCILY